MKINANVPEKYLNLKGTVLPKPTISKILALYVILKVLGRDLSNFDLKFCGTSNPNHPVLKKYNLSTGYYHLDVGDNRYHTNKRNTGSCVVTVIQDFGIRDDRISLLGRWMVKQDATGFLKRSGLDSLPMLVRYMYAVWCKPIAVLSNVFMYLDALFDYEAFWTGLAADAEKDFKATHWLTLKWLNAHLTFKRQVKVDKYFQDAKPIIQEAERLAQEVALYLIKRGRQIKTQSEKTVLVIEMDKDLKFKYSFELISKAILELWSDPIDRLMAVVFDRKSFFFPGSRRFDLLLLKHDSGNCQIMTNHHAEGEINLKAVYDELVQFETKAGKGNGKYRWYLQPGQNGLYNGTPNFPQPATSIPLYTVEDVLRLNC